MQKSEKSFQLTTEDHHSIYATLFRGARVGAHLIIIAPAAGAPQHYYRNFAMFASRGFGFDAITFDYRGVGASKKVHSKASKAIMSDWGKYDINAIINWASDKYDKIFLLGHSVAGQVFPLAEQSDRISAAYFVASQAPYIGYWRGFSKFKTLLFWHIILPATVGIYGYLPGWAMGGKGSLPRGVAREWRDWGLHRNGIMRSDGFAKQKYHSIKIPVHFVGLADDHLFAPSEAIKALMYKYGNAKTFFQYIRPKDLGLKSIGHFGFFKSQFQKKLWSMPIMYFSQYVNKF